jgi:transposase
VKLTPYVGYLRQRWREGCHNGAQLLREIQARGYAGKTSILRDFLSGLRMRAPDSTNRCRAREHRMPFSTRRLARLLTNQYHPKVEEQERQFVAHLAEACSEIATAMTLGEGFCRLVRERSAAGLEEWLRLADQSGLAELKAFATGLMADRAAVEAGLSLAWSNGQTEGQVNRLKCLKR